MTELWTDGSASPNPGPGGFAVLLDGKPVALGREENTTNIRMEGAAMLAAMEYANGEPLEIHSDSEFWKNVLELWAPAWKRNGWRKRSGAIRNLGLVKRVYEKYKAGNVKIVWVKGHAGIEYNELCDEWANKARQGIGAPGVEVASVNTEGDE